MPASSLNTGPGRSRPYQLRLAETDDSDCFTKAADLEEELPFSTIPQAGPKPTLQNTRWAVFPDCPTAKRAEAPASQWPLPSVSYCLSSSASGPKASEAMRGPTVHLNVQHFQALAAADALSGVERIKAEANNADLFLATAPCRVREVISDEECADLHLYCACRDEEGVGAHVEPETHFKKYVGVRRRGRGRWVAEIKDNNKGVRQWLGTFNCPVLAARSFDAAAIAIRGKNTRLNFGREDGEGSAKQRPVLRQHSNKRKVKGLMAGGPEKKATVHAPSKTLRSCSDDCSAAAAPPPLQLTLTALASPPFSSAGPSSAPATSLRPLVALPWHTLPVLPVQPLDSPPSSLSTGDGALSLSGPRASPSAYAHPSHAPGIPPLVPSRSVAAKGAFLEGSSPTSHWSGCEDDSASPSSTKSIDFEAPRMQPQLAPKVLRESGSFLPLPGIEAEKEEPEHNELELCDKWAHGVEAQQAQSSVRPVRMLDFTHELSVTLSSRCSPHASYPDTLLGRHNTCCVMADNQVPGAVSLNLSLSLSLP